MTTIDENKYYRILDEMKYCCEEMQFQHVCKSCEEYMDCYFCGFDPYSSHGCDTL
jgi:hypothetical protein